MTMKTKKELIAQIAALLNEVIEVEEQAAEAIPNPSKPVEMLTHKESSEVIKGLSEHTIVQLAAQEKFPYIRTGQGKRGKILISRSALLEYLGGAA